MARNHDEAPSSKSSKTSEEAPPTWPNLNQDLLSSIMMRLGVIDYVSFNGVCKYWRSLARSEKNKFMSSKLPMKVSLSTNATTECYLTDSEGYKFKTVFPCSIGKRLVGSTCGYLIFFGGRSREFCLVNPITRHELHFPGFPFHVSTDTKSIRGILVFSPLMSNWVLVVSHRFSSVISFSLAGTQPSWDYLSFDFSVLDLHYFKGKIYVLNNESHLFEVKLNAKPVPVLTPITMKNIPQRFLRHREFVSSDENLYVVSHTTKYAYDVGEIDIDNMEWVSPRKTMGEYAFYVSELKGSSAIDPDAWTSYDGDGSKKKSRWVSANLWYFPHECSRANRLE